MSRINVGLVGLGKMGRNHLRVLSEMDSVNVWGAADTDPGAQARAAKDYEGLAIYESLGEMLEAVSLDAVVIAAPTPAHHPLGMAALGAGLHVFVEKPMALRFWQSQELAHEAAKRPNQVFMVGYIERFNPAMKELQKFIGAEGHRIQPRLIEARRSGYVTFNAKGTVITELGSHDLDAMGYLLGESGPDVIRGDGNEDFFVVALSYHKAGVVAGLLVDWLSPDKVRKMRVVCDLGTFYLDYIEQTLIWHPLGFGPQPVEVEKAEPLRLELEHFVACIETGQTPISNGATALNAARILEALHNGQ